MKPFFWRSLTLFCLLLSSLSSLTLQAQEGPGHAYEFVPTPNGGSSFNIGNQVCNGVRTVEMWFRPTVAIGPTLSSPTTLIARDYNDGDVLGTHEFALFFSPSAWGNGGKLIWVRRVNSTQYEIVSDRDQWQANVWYHVAVTMDPVSGMKMYINGAQQQATNLSTQAIMTRTGSIRDEVCIGRWGNTSTPLRIFAGSIDETRLWDIARTETEIRASMCSKLIGNESGLRAYYRFDESSGTNLPDLSPNSYDGTLTNAPTPTWHPSSAPLGDHSAYAYQNMAGFPGWTAPGLGLAGWQYDSLSIANVTGVPDGAHIYRVDSMPDNTVGLTQCFGDVFFGVFIAGNNDTSFNYQLHYHYDAANPLIRPQGNVILYGRKNHIAPQWSDQLASHNAANQLVSRNNNSYRGEFMLSGELEIDLGPDTVLCEGNSVLLDANIGNATYSWQDGSTQPDFQVFTTGLYWVDVMRSAGCQDRDSIQVDFDVPPNASFSYQLNGSAYAFQNMSAGSGNQYTWNFGDGNGSFVQNPTYTFSSAGTYQVTLIVSNGCGSDTTTQTITWDPMIGIDDELDKSHFAVFPIPARDQLSIRYQGASPEEFEIKLFDFDGKLILQQVTPAGSEIDVSMEKLPRGIYLLQIRQGEKTTFFKVPRLP